MTDRRRKPTITLPDAVPIPPVFAWVRQPNGL